MVRMIRTSRVKMMMMMMMTMTVIEIEEFVLVLLQANNFHPTIKFYHG